MLRALARNTALRHPATTVSVALRSVPRSSSITLVRLSSSTSSTESTSTDIKFPPPDKSAGSYHWDFERLLSLSLVPITASWMINGAGHATTDLLLGIVVPLHIHLGLDQVVTDYFPKRRAPGMNKALGWSLKLGTVLVLVGCYQFNTEDIGLTELMKRAWKA